MRPEDLPLLTACSSPTLGVDRSGALVAVVAVTAPDLAADEATGSLWTVPVLTPGGLRRLTRGHRDAAPAASPDGRWVAFLRAGPGVRPQVHLVEVDGGEPVALTTAAQHPLGAGAPSWSPDGGALAYLARVPQAGRYGTPDAAGRVVAAAAEPPRLVTSLDDRLDGVGHLPDRRQHAFVLTISPSDPLAGRTAPRRVSGGDVDDTALAWTADSAWLLLAAARHAGSGEDLRRGIHRVPAHRDEGPGPSGGAAPVVAGDLAVTALAADPDATTVWFLAEDVGPSGVDHVAAPASLYTAPLDGSTPPRRLTDPQTTDLGDPSGFLHVDALGALVADRRRGALHLLRVSAEGTATVVLDGPVQVTAVTSTPDGRSVVAVVADGSSCGDLVVVGGAGRLTDVSAPLRAAGLRPLVEVDHPAPDSYPVHGWVVLPDPAAHGDGPHPVILMIHGGPFAQFGPAVFDEAQIAAGAGYAVVMGNPRGSAGYGAAHGRAVIGALGGVDADDVLALLDGVLADASLPLDPGRVGVQGGSYGGYLAALLTTRTDRFTAAVVERGYLDPVSFVGSSDIGWYFPDAYHGSPQAMREQSPMACADRVRTPTLVIHSEDDLRCPVEQGRRWFAALRRAGVRTELLLFPGEGHELTRSGRPRHRLARFEHVLRWWARHLPV